jgi:hypothetical protein
MPSVLQVNLRTAWGARRRKLTRFQQLTKSVLNQRSPEVWRNSGAESEFWVIPRYRSPEVCVRRPAIIGLFCTPRALRECRLWGSWRRECDWDQTFLGVLLDFPGSGTRMAPDQLGRDAWPAAIGIVIRSAPQSRRAGGALACPFRATSRPAHVIGVSERPKCSGGSLHSLSVRRTSVPDIWRELHMKRWSPWRDHENCR